MIKEFTVTFSRTFSLRPYESARVEASVTMTVEHPENLDGKKTLAQTQLTQLLEETWKAQMEAAIGR